MGNELPMKMCDVGKVGIRSSLANDWESNLKAIAQNLSFSCQQASVDREFGNLEVVGDMLYWRGV